jgi:hypothetical protein
MQRCGYRRQDLMGPLEVQRAGLCLQRHRPTALQLAGKLTSQGCLNAVAPGLLVHIVDQLTGRCFLKDTGTSIFPQFLVFTAVRPILDGTQRQADPLLRRATDRAVVPWPPFCVDIPAGRRPVRHYWLSNRLEDTASLQSFAIVSASIAAVLNGTARSLCNSPRRFVTILLCNGAVLKNELYRY